MSSRKGLTKAEADAIIQLCQEAGWSEGNEANPYLYAKFFHNNDNVKIYSSKHGYTVSCNTELLLNQILDGKFTDFSNYQQIIEIDDAGVGCPVGGLLIGGKVTAPNGFGNSETLVNGCFHMIIEPKLFQSPHFENKDYLQQITKIIQNWLKPIYPLKKDWLIEICTGFVFSDARTVLNNQGYNVKTATVEGVLQDYVEKQFRNYLERKCKIPHYIINQYPSTKEGRKHFFSRLMGYVRKHPLLLPYCKTGWPYFKRNFANYLKE